MTAEDALTMLLGDLEAVRQGLRERKSYDPWGLGYLAGMEQAINQAEQQLKYATAMRV
jgi:hypothetical protein